MSLTVSLGPELIEVPSVWRMPVDQAQQVLEDAGFEVDVEQADPYLGFDLAVSTDPESGELAPMGSTVTLFVI